MLKGFYTSNQWEIDPCYSNYWNKMTKESFMETMSVYNEIFGKKNLSLGVAKKVLDNVFKA
jgi:hypothetical protein